MLKRLNRITAGLLVWCLLFMTACIAVAAENTDSAVKLDGYLMACENKDYALFYQTDTASIGVMDKANGYVWYSALPAGQIPAEGVTNIIKDEFRSLLTVSYTLINKVTSSKTVTPLESLDYELKCGKIANGITYSITIDEISLSFDVKISLDDGGITVSLPEDKIQEGAGTIEQLQAKLAGLFAFIEKSTGMADTAAKKNDYPGSMKSILKSGKKQLNDLKDYIKKIDSVVGIETVSDKILTKLDDIQSSFVGSSSKPGFFNKIAISNKVSGDAKSRYASLKQDFEDSLMPVRIAASALKAINVGSLVEVDVLPYFGACGDKESGYMLYPNGCGAISEFKEKHGRYASNYKSSVFSDAEPDLDWEKEMDTAGLKRTAVPYFGVKRSGNAYIAYVTSGKSESNIIFSPSGYIVDVNRICSSFEYRRTIAVSGTGGQWQAGQIPKAYEEKRNDVNASVYYRFLKGADANYSGMARSLNAYMVQKGILKKSRILSEGVPLAIDLFGGYNQKVLVFDHYITGTTFGQAKAILKKITGNKKIPMLVNYKGYRAGGYGVYPQPGRAAGQLGGMSDLQDLAAYIKKIQGYLFLEDNFIEVQIGRGGYSEGDLALSTNFRVIQSDDKSTYLLSPLKILDQFKKDEIPFYQSTGAFGVTLDRIGTFLYYDYKGYAENQITQRTDTVSVWENILEQSKSKVGGVAVSGGNEYVLPYADWIKDVPDSVTGYLHTDYAVPFYQMLVHGYLPYTSDAVNQYYDKEMQFLKMVEYGNLPYYTLSAENIDTNEAGTYVSQFGIYYSDIIATYNRYAKDLKGVVNSQILSHTKNGDLATVVYSNGCSVYINYADKTVTADGCEIPAKDYLVTKPEGGGQLEKIEESADGQGKQSGISVSHSMDNRIFAILLVSAVLFAGAGIFVYQKRRNLRA